MCKAQRQGVDMLHYGVRMMYRHAHDCLLHSIDDDKNRSFGNTNVRCPPFFYIDIYNESKSSHIWHKALIAVLLICYNLSHLSMLQRSL